jgi:hypothetical protein
MALKRCPHLLILGVCYLMLRRGLLRGHSIKDGYMGRLCWIMCLFNVILRVLKWEEGQSQRRRWKSGTEVGETLLLENGHKQRNVGSL